MPRYTVLVAGPESTKHVTVDSEEDLNRSAIETAWSGDLVQIGDGVFRFNKVLAVYPKRD